MEIDKCSFGEWKENIYFDIDHFYYSYSKQISINSSNNYTIDIVHCLGNPDEWSVFYGSNKLVSIFKLVHGNDFWDKMNYKDLDALKEFIDETLYIVIKFKAFL